MPKRRWSGLNLTRPTMTPTTRLGATFRDRRELLRAIVPLPDGLCA